MTEQSPQNQPLKPGEGKGGCLGLLAGVTVLALTSFALTGVGYLVAHAMHWV
ncbi:MAG: hypothetical protein IT431_00825 [Phycisphaerales bacterium]|nr:hypothetical protein [Phycisphaerales bacterium]